MLKTLKASEVPFDKLLVVSHHGQETAYSLNDLKPGMSMRLGRADDNDIVISDPIVSNYHATIQLRDDNCYLIDGQDRGEAGNYKRSTNGLYLNSGQRIFNEHRLENGERVHILAPKQYTITLVYYDDLSARRQIKPVKLSTSEVTIGRAESNQIVLNALTVSSLHARVQHTDGQYLLIHESRTNPTYLNGKPITHPTALKLNDRLMIGPFELVYDGTALQPVTETREGTRLDAISITKKVPDKTGWLFQKKWKTLLENISLVIQPGEFVALVGGSGAGKSTLLKTLSGVSPIEKPSIVLLNGDDLYANFDIYRQAIGYVPQEEIIHDNLKVEQALSYVARLRRSAPSRKIKEAVDKVLTKVDLVPQKKVLVKNLSGGQKKRVSVAVELISNPAILFLDEPTSGLDPGLDYQLMHELKTLAERDNKTVILVTHATENIDQCDKVAFLAPGGRLTFYGSPAEARLFFEVSRFSEIYKRISEDNSWPERFKEHPYYLQNVKNLEAFRAEVSRLSDKVSVPGKSKVNNPISSLSQFLEMLRQTVILTQRYGIITLTDSRLLWSLLMPPFIALLFYFVADAGLFNKWANLSSQELLSIQSDPLKLKEMSEDMFSMQRVIFMVATIATFFGLFSSIQEIVKERPIYNRERLVNLSIPAYILSKFIILAFLATVQSLLLVYILDLHVEFPVDGMTSLSAWIEIALTFFLTMIAAVCFGLFVSALVNKKQDLTLIVLVGLVTVQIIFGGIIFPLEGNNEFLTWFTLTRWSTEAIGTTVDLGSLPASDQLYLEFGDKTHLMYRWGVLVSYALLFLGLTAYTLYQQDIVKSKKQKS